MPSPEGDSGQPSGRGPLSCALSRYLRSGLFHSVPAALDSWARRRFVVRDQMVCWECPTCACYGGFGERYVMWDTGAREVGHNDGKG